MKMIEAIIKPFKLDEVKEALNGIGVEGITVSEVKGFRPAEGPHRIVPGRGIRGGFYPQSKTCHSGRRRPGCQSRRDHRGQCKNRPIGDGKIFVLPLEEAIRIRTGEKGTDAI